MHMPAYELIQRDKAFARVSKKKTALGSWIFLSQIVNCKDLHRLYTQVTAAMSRELYNTPAVAKVSFNFLLLYPFTTLCMFRAHKTINFTSGGIQFYRSYHAVFVLSYIMWSFR